MAGHLCPHHCPSGSGGAGAVAAVVALAVAAAAVAKPVAHAADVVGHVLAVAVEVALITAASLAGLAIVAGAAVLAARARRRHAKRITAVSFPRIVVLRASDAVSGPRRKSIEAPGRQIGPVDITSAVTDTRIAHRRS
jgi:hypothetical protein